MTIILLTGAPGVGKTTIVMGVAKELKERGMKVGGIVSREVRTNNVRTGFEFIDLATNDRDVLASVTGNGPRAQPRYIMHKEIRIFLMKLGRQNLPHCGGASGSHREIASRKGLIVVS
jgi:nucleoside-triphosphatase THEP1